MIRSVPTQTILLLFYSSTNFYIQRKNTGKAEPKVSMSEESQSSNPHVILNKPNKVVGLKSLWSVSVQGNSEQGRTLAALLPVLTYIMSDSVHTQVGLQIHFSVLFLPNTASWHCLVYLVCSGNHCIHKGWKKIYTLFFLFRHFDAKVFSKL